jgi:hypothetical protein
MSRGPGIVQRRLRAALQGEPARHFTVEELAAVAFPSEPVGRAQLASVRRALKGLAVTRFRVGRSGERGWRYVVGYTP